MEINHFYLALAMFYMIYTLGLIGWISYLAVSGDVQRRSDAYRVLRLVVGFGTTAAVLLLGLARAGVL